MKFRLTVAPKISETFIGTSVTKNDYQPRTNIAKNENGYLFTDSHSIRVVCLDTHQNQ
jgi:hypothetical protein